MERTNNLGARRRDLRLDALRGAAALSVAVGHCATDMSPRPLYDKTFWQIDLANPTEILLRAAHTVFNADAAVLIFFVLSGHVLFQSLARISNRYPVEFTAYVLKRLFRIMPLLLLAVAAISIFEDLSWQVLLACMVLLRTDAMGLTWTLQIEMIGSLLVFVALLVWRWRPALLGGLFASMLAIAIVFSAHYLLRYLPVFLLGCAIGPLTARCKPRGSLFWAGLAALLLADLLLGKTSLALLATTAGAVLLVANASATDARFLDHRALAWLGRVSYSIYLLHPVAKALLMAAARTASVDPYRLPPVLGFLVLSTLSVALTLPVAQLTYRYVELPGIAAGRRFARSLLKTAEPAKAVT